MAWETLNQFEKGLPSFKWKNQALKQGMLWTSTRHLRVWRIFQKLYIICTTKVVVCRLFLWFLCLSFCDFWNCSWKFTGPTVEVIITWDLAKSKTWRSNVYFISCFGRRDLAENPNMAKQRKMPLLYGRHKRRLQRWLAKHTTQWSSHSFDVYHLILDCEIGRASIADSGYNCLLPKCFNKKGSLPIPVHLGFQSRSINFHQHPLITHWKLTKLIH